MSRWLNIVIASLVAICGALAVAYWSFNDEPLMLNDEARRKNTGFQFESSLGITQYDLLGLENSPVVVLVHGVSGPMKVWDKTVTALTNANRRVLRYDLFGRGSSDRVSAEYNPELYDRQLHDLILGLGLKTPVTLVGSSMGAVISTNFVNKHPEMVKSLVLIGPAGFPIEAAAASQLMFVPFVGEYVMGTIGARMLQSHHWKYFVKPESFPEMHAAFAAQLKFKGTKRAILSTMRHMPVRDFSAGYKKIGGSQIPVLLLWGTQDVTFPFHNHAKAQQFIPQASFFPIENAAYLPQYEAAPETNQRIIDFVTSGRE